MSIEASTKDINVEKVEMQGESDMEVRAMATKVAELQATLVRMNKRLDEGFLKIARKLGPKPSEALDKPGLLSSGSENHTNPGLNETGWSQSAGAIVPAETSKEQYTEADVLEATRIYATQFQLLKEAEDNLRRIIRNMQISDHSGGDGMSPSQMPSNGPQSSASVTQRASGSGFNQPVSVLPPVNKMSLASIVTAPDAASPHEGDASTVILSENGPERLRASSSTPDTFMPLETSGPMDAATQSPLAIGSLRRISSLLHKTSVGKYDCPLQLCHRKGRNGFTRKDNLVVHLQAVHNVVIPKRNRDYGSQFGQSVMTFNELDSSTGDNLHQEDNISKHTAREQSSAFQAWLTGTYIPGMGTSYTGDHQPAPDPHFSPLQRHTHMSLGDLELGSSNNGSDSDHYNIRIESVPSAATTTNSIPAIVPSLTVTSADSPHRTAGSVIKGRDHRPFICEVCGKHVDTRWKLEDHKMTHIKTKHQKCDLCGFKTSRRRDLVKHKKNKHYGAELYVSHNSNMSSEHTPSEMGQPFLLGHPDTDTSSPQISEAPSVALASTTK